MDRIDAIHIELRAILGAQERIWECIRTKNLKWGRRFLSDLQQDPEVQERLSELRKRELALEAELEELWGDNS